MAVSQNGYTANVISLTSSRRVPGSNRSIRVRNGPAGDLLLWFAGQFDAHVEDIDPGELDDWGYAERPIRGGVELSNHASGTAIDLNAPRHPLGTNPSANFSPSQIGEIHRLLALAGGCIGWGGDYSGRKDPMHFEIVASEATCQAALNRLNAQEEDDMDSQEFRDTDIIWWNQKKMKVNDVLAELHVLYCGLAGVPAFPGEVSVSLPGLASIKAQTERIDDVEGKISAVIQALGALGTQLATALTSIDAKLTAIDNQVGN